LLKRNTRHLNPPPASPEAVPQLARIIPRDAHPVSRSRISPDALRVLYRLKEAGYQAFLVGGCVRDLIIGEQPKDFDVVTDALPEEVRRLFRNCRLVGRRFRLAHVMYGRHVIEVATFRASGVAPEPEDALEADEDDVELEGDDDLDDADADGAAADDEDQDIDGAPEDEDASAADEALSDGAAGEPQGRVPPSQGAASAGSTDRVVDALGRIVRDNVYGSIDEDVWRRDFTANSLYYNIADFSIWDYVGGFEDAQARRLRLIGDPETRYREDPVRMLRGARFEAKLGFTLDASTAEPLGRLRELLGGVPPARLFDETLKLFLSGHGVRSFEVLQRRGLLEALLPSVGAFARLHPGSPPAELVRIALESTDARVTQDRPVSPTFLFAALIYGPVAIEIEAAPRERWSDVATILGAVDQVLRGIVPRVSIPRRFTLGVREMYALQPRLEAPRGRRALRLLEHPRFRAAFDLLELRARCGMAPAAIVAWWQALQREPDAQARLALAEQRAADRQPTSGGDGRPRRRRRGGRGRSRGGGPG
jgi:poly(A) polymerase